MFNICVYYMYIYVYNIRLVLYNIIIIDGYHWLPHRQRGHLLQMDSPKHELHDNNNRIFIQKQEQNPKKA